MHDNFDELIMHSIHRTRYVTSVLSSRLKFFKNPRTWCQTAKEDQREQQPISKPLLYVHAQWFRVSHYFYIPHMQEDCGEFKDSEVYTAATEQLEAVSSSQEIRTIAFYQSRAEIDVCLVKCVSSVLKQIKYLLIDTETRKFWWVHW